LVARWWWHGAKSKGILGVFEDSNGITHSACCRMPMPYHCANGLLALQKEDCENMFRAITNALLGSNSCDRTGKAAIACARHGCYAPNALVDLFKGEQQKNVDYALLQALKTTGVDPDQGVLMIYDIACQYFVHLTDRIGEKLPKGLEVDRVISLFHVHAHKDECFF
jgi:hypothetical protein